MAPRPPLRKAEDAPAPPYTETAVLLELERRGTQRSYVRTGSKLIASLAIRREERS